MLTLQVSGVRLDFSLHCMEAHIFPFLFSSLPSPLLHFPYPFSCFTLPLPSFSPLFDLPLEV